MQRTAGHAASLASSGLCVVVRIWHPGETAPAIMIDLLDDGSDKNSTPVIITPDGKELKISIAGGTGEIKVPAEREFIVALSSVFRRQKNGKYDVQLNVVANPNPKASNPAANLPACALLRHEVTLPAELSVTIRSQGTAERGFSVSEIKVGRKLKEALR